MTGWTLALELDSARRTTGGSESTLCDAIQRGADLRIHTSFVHGEHVDPSSESEEVVEETCEFAVTYLLDNRWTAGIMTLRQPVSLPDAFGERPSMSFFLYNQDGQQAIARSFLDGQPATGGPGAAPTEDHSEMPKYHQHDNWDPHTNAPSHNFVYDFDLFRYWVRDDWRQVLSNIADGTVISGSVEALAQAVAEGNEVKVGIRGLCTDLAAEEDLKLEHEVFVQTGSCYYYTDEKLFIAGTHPVVRVCSSIPLGYKTEAWDFGWLICRSDGFAARRLCDPYTLKFRDSEACYAMRWFVR